MHLNQMIGGIQEFESSVLPNKYEQKKIADFLDGQCEKIN